MIETGRKKFLRKSKEIKNRMPNYVEEMGLGRKLTDKLKSHRIEYVTDILSCTEKELRETVVLNDREMSLLREKMREFQLDFWDELF